MRVDEDGYNHLLVTLVIEVNSKESFELYFGSDKPKLSLRQHWDIQRPLFENYYNFWMSLRIWNLKGKTTAFEKMSTRMQGRILSISGINVPPKIMGSAGEMLPGIFFQK